MHFKFYFPRIQEKYNHKITIQFFCFQCQKLCVNAKRTVMIYRREILTNSMKQNSSCEAGCHSARQPAFACYRTRKCIYVFTTDCLSCLSWASSVQSTQSYSVCLNPAVISLPSHSFKSYFFASGFPNKLRYQTEFGQFSQRVMV